MGLFNNIGRGALGWSTGGLSELGRKDPFGMGGGNRNSSPTPWKPITAKGTSISPDLAAALGGAGAVASTKIRSNYADANKKQAMGAKALGKRTGSNSYGAERMATTQGLDQGNLEAALGGQLGSTAYENALQDRDYDQNLGLVDQIAALNRPDMLEQIFSGIGAVGTPVADYMGMKSGQAKSKKNSLLLSKLLGTREGGSNEGQF